MIRDLPVKDSAGMNYFSQINQTIVQKKAKSIQIIFKNCVSPDTKSSSVYWLIYKPFFIDLCGECFFPQS